MKNREFAAKDTAQKSSASKFDGDVHLEFKVAFSR